MNKMMIVLVFLLCGAVTHQLVAQSATTEQKVQTIKLKITGMTCAGCANHVSNALDKVEGVVDQEVEFPGDVATVKYDASKTNVQALIKAVEGAGYKASILKDAIDGIPHGKPGHVCSPEKCGMPGKKKGGND